MNYSDVTFDHNIHVIHAPMVACVCVHIGCRFMKLLSDKKNRMEACMAAPIATRKVVDSRKCSCMRKQKSNDFWVNQYTRFKSENWQSKEKKKKYMVDENLPIRR